MPYIIRKQKNKWILVNRETNKPHKSSKGKIIYYNSRADALGASKAIMASEHGWNPKKV